VPPHADRSPALELRPAQLALPVLSATCFGLVAILRKLGLSHMGAVVSP
jgi:hypothetical protein